MTNNIRLTTSNCRIFATAHPSEWPLSTSQDRNLICFQHLIVVSHSCSPELWIIRWCSKQSHRWRCRKSLKLLRYAFILIRSSQAKCRAHVIPVSGYDPTSECLYRAVVKNVSLISVCCASFEQSASNKHTTYWDDSQFSVYMFHIWNWRILIKFGLHNNIIGEFILIDFSENISGNETTSCTWHKVKIILRYTVIIRNIFVIWDIWEKTGRNNLQLLCSMMSAPYFSRKYRGREKQRKTTQCWVFVG